MNNPTTNFETISPEKAERLLLTNRSNRNINDSHVRTIVSSMKRGEFKTTGDSIKISKSGKLLDGQHRLTAIVQTGISLKLNVVRGLEEDSFKYMDIGKGRTASDILHIEGVSNSSKIAAISKFVMNFQKGYYQRLANKHDGTGNTKLTNADISDFTRKHIDSLHESCKVGYKASKTKLATGTDLSGLHYVLKKISKEEADTFIQSIGDGLNLTKGSPIHILRERLLSNSQSKRKMLAYEKLAIIIKTWNYYRTNKRVSRVLFDTVREEFPKPI
jgi:hypothetical protein